MPGCICAHKNSRTTWCFPFECPSTTGAWKKLCNTWVFHKNSTPTWRFPSKIPEYPQFAEQNSTIYASSIRARDQMKFPFENPKYSKSYLKEPPQYASLPQTYVTFFIVNPEYSKRSERTSAMLKFPWRTRDLCRVFHSKVQNTPRAAKKNSAIHTSPARTLHYKSLSQTTHDLLYMALSIQTSRFTPSVAERNSAMHGFSKRTQDLHVVSFQISRILQVYWKKPCNTQVFYRNSTPTWRLQSKFQEYSEFYWKNLRNTQVFHKKSTSMAFSIKISRILQVLSKETLQYTGLQIVGKQCSITRVVRWPPRTQRKARNEFICVTRTEQRRKTPNMFHEKRNTPCFLYFCSHNCQFFFNETGIRVVFTSTQIELFHKKIINRGFSRVSSEDFAYVSRKQVTLSAFCVFFSKHKIAPENVMLGHKHIRWARTFDSRWFYCQNWQKEITKNKVQWVPGFLHVAMEPWHFA